LQDISFHWLALAAAFVIVVLIVLVGWELYRGSRLALHQFGFGFWWARSGSGVQRLRRLPFIFGTSSPP